MLLAGPGLPRGQVLANLTSLLDVFPTLAKFTGGKVPTDRILDGVDQSGFFMGKAEKSARESMVIYIGNTLFGAKWRNWKILLRELVPTVLRK